MTHPVYYFVVAGPAANDPSYLTRDAQRVAFDDGIKSAALANVGGAK